MRLRWAEAGVVAPVEEVVLSGDVVSIAAVEVAAGVTTEITVCFDFVDAEVVAVGVLRVVVDDVAAGVACR